MFLVKIKWNEINKMLIKMLESIAIVNDVVYKINYQTLDRVNNISHLLKTE